MKPKSPPAKAHAEIEIVRLLWLAIFVSVFSFFYYYRHGDLLLYGDAVAHINIARRVFDSKTPGLLQLGTVWLPLPHLLILPFIVSNQMWQSGAGGSMPSMAAFALGVIGIFRLVRTILGPDGEGQYAAKLGAWAAAILYVANPNLIFMQATAMGEALYLAFFIWAIALFAEFVRGNPKALTRCGLCLAAACLTRYDGWFLAGILVLAAIAFHLRNEFKNDPAAEAASPSSRAAILKFILIAAAAPVLWLAYNAAVYRNPLEFANGPYSAKAIEQKTATVNPAKENLVAAGSYFLKAGRTECWRVDLDGTPVARSGIAGKSVSVVKPARPRRIVALDSTPFLRTFGGLCQCADLCSPWWPFSTYNVRYGLQLLPAFAVFVPMGVSFLVQSAMKFTSFGSSRSRWADTCNRAGNPVVGGIELCRNLARRSHLLSRGRGQHEIPLRPRSPTRGVDQELSPEFHAANVSGRARRRAGASRDSVAAHHQRRQSSRMETPLRSGRLVGAGAR